MPPYNQVTKDHLKDVLAGKHSFLLNKDIKVCKITQYSEISVKLIYERALKHPNLAKYMPPALPKGRTIDKEYFYNVFNTLYPEEVSALLKHANEKRYTVENDTVKENSILLTDDWANQLEEMPFVSKQKGRMSHLLKQKSKFGVERKDRVTYEAYDFLKRPRGS